jgi:hypothetical protein
VRRSARANFVDDLDTLVAEIAERGLAPAKQETYSNAYERPRISIPT